MGSVEERRVILQPDVVIVAEAPSLVIEGGTPER
jgi:hypothetical protein